ncbi:hypothetical protein EOM33_01105 [Candidatus Saccharibacteria bacterium]|nr:hypothetical protein [Candidatus Saccharibacteria bacterium]
MSDISDNAFTLLSTVKKRGRKLQGTGTFFTEKDIAYWYRDDSEEELLDDENKLAIKELLERKLAKNWQDEDDEFILTPYGESFKRSNHASAATITQNFSNIHGSNIANMSENVCQTLNIDSYNEEVKNQFTQLQEAVKTKDDKRARAIIDGLWVSAPGLVLQLLQIGLGVTGGQS